MRRAVVLALALALAPACGAVVDIYHYQPRMLPPGMAPFDAMTEAVRGLTNVNWPTTRERATFERARVTVERDGLSAIVTSNPAANFPFFVSYGEIAHRTAFVAHSGGAGHDRWVVHVRDRFGEDVELVFRDLGSTRLFLDAATAISRS